MATGFSEEHPEMVGEVSKSVMSIKGSHPYIYQYDPICPNSSTIRTHNPPSAHAAKAACGHEKLG